MDFIYGCDETVTSKTCFIDQFPFQSTENLTVMIIKAGRKSLESLDELIQFIDPSVLSKQLNGTHSDFTYILPTNKDLIMITNFYYDIITSEK
ncbi:unnamed protein product [Rotaria sp. Silwood1]|nr:unnamed protein product [Rotaria sp. Silwood1]CAF0971342.1 unnamed protein product [Rotaria sp. Silwood1]CAF0980574.1 unnamed protein product [Rotaria sp. Silwood1]